MNPLLKCFIKKAVIQAQVCYPYLLRGSARNGGVSKEGDSSYTDPLWDQERP
jgi:hypothetical protein